MYMIIRIINSNNTPIDLFKAKKIITARRLVVAYRLPATERLVESKLKLKYNLYLKPTCLKLLLSASWSTDQENNLVLTFTDPEYNTIAEFITYGDGTFIGSHILRDLLT